MSDPTLEGPAASSAPASYPAAGELPRRPRAAFSRGFAALSSHHADPPTLSLGEETRRRRVRHDASLRLIDDLTNRPVDPMFNDSRLATKPRSALDIWGTKAIVFLLCIAVGFAGSLFVQRLHSDPRKAVRTSLAADLESQSSELDKLSREVETLRGQVEEQSKRHAGTTRDETQTNDEMTNGMLPVTGEGITMTLADPIATGDKANGSTPREGAGTERIRVITDADLQQLVSLLWSNGAEAIAINGKRLGVQTSIRTAGTSILVGVAAVESPYKIEAIGDKDRLSKAMGSEALPALYESYAQAGIFPQISKSKAITLEAAVSGELSYARRN